MNHKKTLGDHYEKRVQSYLIKQQLKPIAHNYSCPYGEIDLIMLDNNTLAFIEIKFRSHHHYGGAIASLSRSKQTKMIRTAQYFMMQHSHYHKLPIRFDFVACDRHSLHWIKAAFEVIT